MHTQPASKREDHGNICMYDDNRIFTYIKQLYNRHERNKTSTDIAYPANTYSVVCWVIIAIIIVLLTINFALFYYNLTADVMTFVMGSSLMRALILVSDLRGKMDFMQFLASCVQRHENNNRTID
jgi:hypothetical protein